MSMALSYKLRHTWRCLQLLPRSSASPAVQQELNSLLAATVTVLFQSYPDQLTAAQHQLLRHLLVVEHQYTIMPERALAEPSCWEAVRDTLLASVAATFPAPLVFPRPTAAP
ncbi:hypothetical protein [Hymenobacter volaticus]|uniref:Uncharacterized protein n=1 Tax=Hymenobacter volaticus TaxID=2932254 RepID=A0ABY4GDD8_9BACT|nr:hypothetical protein [Hymenobacter volaticus]UOQ68916.1 hypothetical protein MUN86_24740 [Hymenobacter volaticus]